MERIWGVGTCTTTSIVGGVAFVAVLLRGRFQISAWSRQGGEGEKGIAVSGYRAKQSSRRAIGSTTAARVSAEEAGRSVRGGTGCLRSQTVDSRTPDACCLGSQVG
jgi:hypothetical protein